MLRTTLFRPALAAVAALAIAACRDNPTPTGPDARPVSPNLQASQAAADLPSAAELDRQIPGFGGVFLDRDGSPTIYLTRGAGRGPAERALAGYLGARGLSVAALHVREAQYGWQQLERWQDAATDGAFQIAGTVFVDNDETSNRVLIGVENAGSIGQVRAALARSGLPDDAVILNQVEPIVQVATLQNVIQNSVMAGVQINFPRYLCSLGFNAVKDGQASFVTASHCTNTQGGTESTPYWQPLQSVRSTQIAVEVDDPTYRKGAGCPGGRVCRYSDASRAAYMNGITGALGQIAQTSGPNNNSLDLVNGSFSITSNDCDGQTGKLGGCLAAGATVNKVGRTTGWTQGSITNTCVNTGVQGSRIVQLCQTFVTAGVGGGDSGSDVFQITSGSNVKLAGILWGGSSSGTQFVYSPLFNVMQELGTLTTH
jgi:hypothetical protein